ncbi:MAG: hypothetical protein AAFO07_27870, partial [Bacteroidota bacterium]
HKRIFNIALLLSNWHYLFYRSKNGLEGERKEHLASDKGAALNASVKQSLFLGKKNTALTFLVSFLRQGKKERLK